MHAGTLGCNNHLLCIDLSETGDVLADRSREQLYILRQITNIGAQFVLVPLINVGPIQSDFSSHRGPYPDQEPRESGFPRSTRPENAQHLSRRNGKTQVSNHGARQLDTVCSTLRALPEAVKAAGGRAEVLMDGGIRRGADIAKALCLGAKGVLIGRAYAYGMAAAGQSGVARALEILREDFERTLRLLGCPSASELDPTYVSIPRHWN